MICQTLFVFFLLGRLGLSKICSEIDVVYLEGGEMHFSRLELRRRIWKILTDDESCVVDVSLGTAEHRAAKGNAFVRMG